MAAAIIRDAAAASSSARNASLAKAEKSKDSQSPQTLGQQQTTRPTASKRQSAAPLFPWGDCRCLRIGCSPTSTTESSPYRLLTPPVKRKHLAGSDNETIDFRNSYSTAVCNCSKCPREDFKFVDIDSFSKSNLSTSTAFDYTTTTEGSHDHTSASEPHTPPPREYSNNTRTLGILEEKNSPLFGPSQGVSLRTQEPFYSEYLSDFDTFISPQSLQKYKENIDYTATDALLSMNGGRKSANSSASTVPIGNGATDINRNTNGVPKHWTIMTSSSMEKREHLYKILVIGELGTGKTSFIKRYVHQFFSQNYRATIGVDFALKVLHWDPNTIIRLQLWDIAGQERFGNMTRVYYKEAVGAFIVFDVTRSGTFECVSKWKEDLDSKVQLPDGSPIPCILLANKCDQDKQGVVTNSEKMDEYVKEHGFAGWFETSAKENINIDEAARALVNKILLNDKLISASDLADSEKFNLNSSGDQSQGDGKNKCAC